MATIGPFTVASADGQLIPQGGTPSDDREAAVSVISTATKLATPALALAEVAAYAATVGTQIAFRGVSCFCAAIEIDHQATDSNGNAIAAAKWSLVTPASWSG